MSLLLALLAGLAQAVSIATPWNGQSLWWLQIVSLALLVLLLNAAPSPKRAAVLGWLFALAWIAGSTWWLYISMHHFGGLAAPLAALAVLALSGFAALYYAAVCALYAWLLGDNNSQKRTNTAYAAIIFAACWLLAELARDTWFTGFPWAAGGYAQVDGPFASVVQWLGVYGLGFVLSMLAAALAQLGAELWAQLRGQRLHQRHRLQLQLWLGLAVLLCGLLLARGAARLAPLPGTGKLSVALLQGNIPQGEKFDTEVGVPLALQWYGEQLQANTAALVVAPETAIPLLPRQLPEGYFAALQQRFAQGQQAALIGIPLGNMEAGYTNSVIGLAPGQVGTYTYSKHHLVPFGEFTPAFFKWFTALMNIPLGDFNRGALGQPSFAWQGQRLAPNICYEDLFGDELALRFLDPATAPSIMVNVSNIGWFGDSVAIDQHLAISRMRALELGRPMIRATNTGPTVIIDHQGRVTHSLPRLTRGVLLGEVEGRSGTTPYAWWVARFGLWPLWLLAIAIILLAVYARRMRVL